MHSLLSLKKILVDNFDMRVSEITLFYDVKQRIIPIMTPEEKILYFEYTISKLLDWYKQLGNDESKNNFSVLKSLKLLFFVSAAKAEPGKKSLLLEDVFTDFYALPYGHVESVIYDSIKGEGGNLKYFKLSSIGLSVNDVGEDDSFKNLDNNIKQEIDDSIDYLKSKNKYLVTMFPFDLVNLSHAWYSWQQYYKIAKGSGNSSIHIPPDVIKDENKIFTLSVF